MCFLGQMYLNGDGVEKNSKKAFKYLSKSSSKNNSSALLNLAMIYQQGIYIEKDFPKSIELLLQSYYLGNKKALYLIGNSYENPLLGPQYEKSRHYYELAIENDDLESMHNLAILYQKVISFFFFF